MEDNSALADFKHALKLLRNGHPNDALEYFRLATKQRHSNPYYLSFLGVCIARAQRKWDEALQLCEEAVRLKRSEPQLYLNMAEVCICAGRREDAIDILDAGLRYCGSDERIKRARNRFGKRGSIVFPFLERRHFLNKNLGRIRYCLSEMIAKLERRNIGAVKAGQLAR
jgi:predicted Zn-dependent protease